MLHLCFHRRCSRRRRLLRRLTRTSTTPQESLVLIFSLLQARAAQRDCLLNNVALAHHSSASSIQSLSQAGMGVCSALSLSAVYSLYCFLPTRVQSATAGGLAKPRRSSHRKGGEENAHHSSCGHWQAYTTRWCNCNCYCYCCTSPDSARPIKSMHPPVQPQPQPRFRWRGRLGWGHGRQVRHRPWGPWHRLKAWALHHQPLRSLGERPQRRP